MKDGEARSNIWIPNGAGKNFHKTFSQWQKEENRRRTDVKIMRDHPVERRYVVYLRTRTSYPPNLRFVLAQEWKQHSPAQVSDLRWAMLPSYWIMRFAHAIASAPCLSLTVTRSLSLSHSPFFRSLFSTGVSLPFAWLLCTQPFSVTFSWCFTFCLSHVCFAWTRLCECVSIFSFFCSRGCACYCSFWECMLVFSYTLVLCILLASMWGFI